MAFPKEIYGTNWIKVGCTFMHVPYLPQGKH